MIDLFGATKKIAHILSVQFELRAIVGRLVAVDLIRPRRCYS